MEFIKIESLRILNKQIVIAICTFFCPVKRSLFVADENLFSGIVHNSPDTTSAPHAVFVLYGRDKLPLSGFAQV